MIRLGTTDFGNEERKAIADLISVEDPNLTMGKYTKKFEELFARWVGVKYAIAVNSGTSALIIALKALLEYIKGSCSYVLTTPLTYPATWNSIINSKLIPVYRDINLNSLNIEIDVDEIFSNERLYYMLQYILLPVHLFGNPIRNIKELSEVFLLIEDCSQAHGSTINGKKVGSFGIAGCFSFYPAHTITTIEGGMITTNDKDFAEICYSLRDNGRICTCNPCTLKTNGRCKKQRLDDEEEIRWKTKYYGFNMKMTEFQAALGVVKMKKIDKICERRHKIMLRYLEEIPNGVFSSDNKVKIVPMAYPIFTKKDKKTTMLRLRSKGIEARGMFIAKDNNYENAVYATKHGLYIPCHQNLTDEQIDYIINVVKEVV